MKTTPCITRIAAAALAMFITIAAAHAQQGRGCVNDRYGNPQCPPPGGHCMANINGDIRCSTPGGGILLDRYRTPVCGPGQCIANRTGDILCSATARGSAALNITGEPVCTAGCVAASAEVCVVPVQ